MTLGQEIDEDVFKSKEEQIRNNLKLCANEPMRMVQEPDARPSTKSKHRPSNAKFPGLMFLGRNSTHVEETGPSQDSPKGKRKMFGRT